MIDPGALGTLRINLDHAQRVDADGWSDQPATIPATARREHLAHALAFSLRRLADTIDRSRPHAELSLKT